MSEIKKLFAEKNPCYISNFKIRPAGIIIHSTGANMPLVARYAIPNKYNNAVQQITTGEGAIAHYYIGVGGYDPIVYPKVPVNYYDMPLDIIQTLPENIACWSSGSGDLTTAKKNGFSSNNANFLGYLQIEVCEDALVNSIYFDKIVNALLYLCEDICRNNFLEVTQKTVIDHAEAHILGIASNHADISHWFKKQGYSMEMFRTYLANRLKSPQPENDVIYTVQCGAFKEKINAEKMLKNLKNAGFDGYITIKE